MAATILSLFTELHPPVMVSSASPACSLTIDRRHGLTR